MSLPNTRTLSSGFTIVELIIVITVISILTTIALVSFSTIQASARDAQRQQNITAIQTALERFYGEYQSYPTPNSWGNMLTFGIGAAPGNGGLCGPGVSWAQGSACVAGYFLSNIPSDPKCRTAGMGYGTSGNWEPCGIGSRPSYTYAPGNCSGGACSSYTITLGKESGGTVTFRSPQ